MISKNNGIITEAGEGGRYMKVQKPQIFGNMSGHTV